MQFRGSINVVSSLQVTYLPWVCHTAVVVFEAWLVSRLSTPLAPSPPPRARASGSPSRPRLPAGKRRPGEGTGGGSSSDGGEGAAQGRAGGPACAMNEKGLVGDERLRDDGARAGALVGARAFPYPVCLSFTGPR